MENQKLTSEEVEFVKNDEKKAGFVLEQGLGLADYIERCTNHIESKAYQLIGVLPLLLPLVVAFKPKTLNFWFYLFVISYGFVFVLLFKVISPKGTEAPRLEPKKLLKYADQNYVKLVSGYLSVVQTSLDKNLKANKAKGLWLRTSMFLLFSALILLVISYS